MTWWAWTLIWFVLVVGSGVVFFLVGRSLFRKGMALADELSEAAERMSALNEQLETLNERASGAAEQPAIFSDPARLRVDRVTARRLAGDRSRAKT